MTSEPLSELQIRMLTVGVFHLDGWTSARGHEAASDLLQRGLLTCYVGGSDEAQYTSLNYSLSDAGRAVRDQLHNKQENSDG